MPESAARASIRNAVIQYGSNVTLTYKPAANLPVGGDWPNPNSPTLGPPDPKVVKAIVAPSPGPEGATSNTGVQRTEGVQAVFLPEEDLNDVETITWQTNLYKIDEGDTYELSGEMLAQVVSLSRVAANVVMPHG